MKEERSIGPAEVLALLVVLISLVWMAAVVWELWRPRPTTQVLGPAQHIERDAHEVALELAAAWPTTTTSTTTTTTVPVTAAPRPAAPRVNRGAPARPSAPAGGGSIWLRLAACESGDLAKGTYNPAAVSASGTYRGAFQFSVTTWESVGGTGDPAAASFERQLELAQKLKARSGWGQWPHCSKTLGLR